MVSAIGNTRTPSSADTLLSATTSSASTTSFAQQLATALEQYLGQVGQTGQGTQFEIDIQQGSSQSSGSGQILVTVKTVAPPQVPQSTLPATSASTPSSPIAPPGTPSATTPIVVSDPGAGQPGSPGTIPPGYTSIPFGLGTTVVPTLATALAKQDAMMAVMSPAAILNQDKVSAAGDPLAGVSIPGTNYNWDQMTQDQQFAYIYAMNYGLPQGQNMQAYLDANLGPQIMANAPSNNPTLFGTA